MNETTTALGVLLGIVGFIAGRSCIITERLRKRNKKNEETIHALRCERDRIEKEMAKHATTLNVLQHPYLNRPRTFTVKELSRGCFVVMMTVDMSGIRSLEDTVVSIPIKYSIDEDDPEFARSEAEEFKAKCEEA